jgi:hypothetical protein
MQVLVIAVQNAVDYAELGVATSGATLFRLIGGSLGTAAFGAIFAARLSANISRALPGGATEATTGLSPQMLAQMPPATRALYVEAFTASLGAVFLGGAALVVIGFALAWLVPEQPLRESIAAAAGDPGREAEAVFPLPSDASSLFRLERALSLLATRDVRREYIASVVERAGVDVAPLEAWLLVRLDEDPALDIDALSRSVEVPADRLRGGLGELGRKGLVDGPTPGRLTPAGCDVLRRLVEARRARLAEVIAEWSPGRRDELAGVIATIQQEMVADAP